MIRCSVFATTFILCAAGPLMAEEGQEPSLLLQVESLTLLEKHLNEALKTVKSRDAALVEYLDSTGKAQEYENFAGPDSAGPRRLTYEQMIETARAHIQKNKMEVSGPFGPIKDMSKEQLGRTLVMLEKATQKRYAEVEEKRDVAHHIGSYLHSIGKFDAYMKWAGVEAVKADEEHSAEMAQRRAAAAKEREQKKEQLHQAEANNEAAKQDELNQEYHLKQQEIQARATAAEYQHGPGYVAGYWDDYPGWNGYADRWHDGRIRRPVGERGREAVRHSPRRGRR